MLNPLTTWEPGTLVRYEGSLTDLHGTYQVYPCTCLRCDNPNLGSIRFELLDENDTTVVSCVRARSITLADTNASADDDAHSDCIEPHRDSDGEYINCDGNPL